MTRDEARRRAVEAAVWAYLRHSNKPAEVEQPRMQAALDAYERAMADAGWRMVRDVGDSDGDACLNPYAGEVEGSWMYDSGWDAARRAMLADDAGDG